MNVLKVTINKSLSQLKLFDYKKLIKFKVQTLNNLMFNLFENAKYNDDSITTQYNF